MTSSGGFEDYIRLRAPRYEHDIGNTDTGGERPVLSASTATLTDQLLFLGLEPTCQESLKPRMLPLSHVALSNSPSTYSRSGR